MSVDAVGTPSTVPVVLDIRTQRLQAARRAEASVAASTTCTAPSLSRPAKPNMHRCFSGFLGGLVAGLSATDLKCGVWQMSAYSGKMEA